MIGTSRRKASSGSWIGQSDAEPGAAGAIRRLQAPTPVLLDVIGHPTRHREAS